MIRFYGIDIGDFWRGDMSLRRLRVLVQALPAESATYRAAQGNNYGEAEYLLHHIANSLKVYTEAQYPAAHGAKDLGEFVPLPVPNANAEREVAEIEAARPTREAVHAMFSRMRESGKVI